MGLFDDLDIEDFSSSSNSNNHYTPTYTHRFNSIRLGFKSLNDNNDTFFRNMFGETRYYLKKRNVWNAVRTDKWLFRIMSKDNNLLHEEIFNDDDIELNIRPFLRREVLKDIIDLDD